MRATMFVFQGISTGLILSAGMIGCVHAEADVSVTRSERTSEPPTVVASREETRSQNGTEQFVVIERDTTVRMASTTRDAGLATAEAQHARVTLVTAEAPPLTRAEIPSHEPRDGEFWVAGNWRGESGQYVWQSGRIEQDRTGQHFVPANWVPSARGWEFTPEFWR
jgi:hypothetical protein